VTGPLDQAQPKFRPGSTARVEVGSERQDRTLLPGGTLDSFDIWLELQAADATASDLLEWPGGRWRQSPVEPGDIFISIQLDATATRSISATPGRRAACFTSTPFSPVPLHSPLPPETFEDAKGRLLDHKLNHRKFSWYYSSLLTPETEAGGRLEDRRQSQRRRVQVSTRPIFG